MLDSGKNERIIETSNSNGAMDKKLPVVPFLIEKSPAGGNAVENFALKRKPISFQSDFEDVSR